MGASKLYSNNRFHITLHGWSKETSVVIVDADNIVLPKGAKQAVFDFHTEEQAMAFAGITKGVYESSAKRVAHNAKNDEQGLQGRSGVDSSNCN